MTETLAPTADVSPLGNFSHCHAGIISHLNTFGELSALLEPAARARLIARETLTFFRGAVFDHHKEEEKDLFPAVLRHAVPGAERAEVQAMVERLTAEHRRIEELWLDLEPQLEKVAKGADVKFDSAAAQELVGRYQAHARFEEDRLLPLAQQILGRHSADLAELGLALHTRHVVMAARRGLRGS
ncbi:MULTISPECIES: hemerythrin domain-containing protein [unclassified Acidovorax]|uniref:hemerythrin domain-containing protein n=1 Tax=unclassified Acidovorax TaxID=2684926 RepID=UPI000B406268|nr:MULTISPECIES: hemerythrin domain-containing protein [unclassified Acidovorax]